MTNSSTVTEVHDDALIPTTPRDATTEAMFLVTENCRRHNCVL